MLENSVSTIGTVGHVDHGKSTLLSAITARLEAMGLAPLRSVDELNRAEEAHVWGVPRNRIHVEYRTTRRRFVHVDCPGHVDFVKSLIAGSLALEGALLVVSAVDGPMKHTREQVQLLKQVNVPISAVFLNKTDTVADQETTTRVEREVRDLLTECGHDGERVTVIRGSALRALNEPGNNEATAPVEMLIDVLDEMVPRRRPEEMGPFIFPVESVFMDTRGLVATGTVERGEVRVGHDVRIAGLREPDTIEVTAIHREGESMSRAAVGDRVEISFSRARKESVVRGVVFGSPGIVRISDRFRAVAYLLTAAEGGRQTPTPVEWIPNFQVRTAELEGVAARTGKPGIINPGEHAELDVELMRPVALEENLHFGIKETGRTVGAGVVTQVIS